MANRTLHLILLVALGIAAIVIARYSPPNQPPPATAREPDALALVPAGAEFVATVDVQRLRETRLGRWLTANGRQLPGLGALDEVCGSDPTELMARLVIAIPAPEPSRQNVDFGAIALGDFAAQDIVECATSVVRERGGKVGLTPIGTFTTIRDRDDARQGEVAIRDGGPAILGGGSYLRDLIDVAEGRGRSVLDEKLHGPLRAAADPGGDAVILATWLPREGSLTLLSQEGGNVWRALRGLALTLRVSPRFDLRLLLACTPKAGCQQLATAVRTLQGRLAEPLREQLGIELEQASIDVHEQQVTVALRLEPDAAEKLLTRLLRMQAPLGTAP